MINGQSFFDQSIKYDLITYDKIWKIASGQGCDYTTGCLLGYDYFWKYMIAIDLGKQHALDADPKATQQVNFNGNLENQSKILFTIEEAKETV